MQMILRESASDIYIYVQHNITCHVKPLDFSQPCRIAVPSDLGVWEQRVHLWLRPTCALRRWLVTVETGRHGRNRLGVVHKSTPISERSPYCFS